MYNYLYFTMQNKQYWKNSEWKITYLQSEVKDCILWKIKLNSFRYCNFNFLIFSADQNRNNYLCIVILFWKTHLHIFWILLLTCLGIFSLYLITVNDKKLPKFSLFHAISKYLHYWSILWVSFSEIIRYFWEKLFE